MRAISMTGAALAIILAGSTAATALEWDTDADQVIDREEFDAGARGAGVYGTWDADRSGMLDRDEFYGGMYGAWDTNDDLAVDTQEFGSAGLGWFDREYGDVDAWDTNADGVIGEDEFGSVAYDSGVYEDWGGSEQGLQEDDFYEGLYGAADYNDDAEIGHDEDGWFDWF